MYRTTWSIISGINNHVDSRAQSLLAVKHYGALLLDITERGARQ